MGQTLLVIDSDREDGERLSEPFRVHGWDVTFANPRSPDVIESIAEEKPLAAVFCMACSSTAELESLALRVLDDPRVLRPLMVFIGGQPDEIALLKASIPVGVFVREDELPWVLKHLAFKF